MGKFIVIEGTDCSGKETQSKLLVEKLTKLGKKAIRITFPNYDSPTGKIVGGPYLGKEEICSCWFPEGAVNVDPKVACLYYAADRKYNEKEIRKYLDEDYFVICDRYLSSNMAHQGSKIHDDNERFNMYQWIDKLEYWLLGLPKPDKTIFLHVPYSYAFELKKSRISLDEHEKSEEHLKNSEIAYLELSSYYNWVNINCIKDKTIRTIEDINEEIMNNIKEYL
jgi:dTMP kinase